MSQHQLRAEMSKTQKMIYVAYSNATSSSGLFKSVGDFSHCKNLFGKANHALHFAAEEIYGSSLRRSELFLHLRCRPGKRRLKNFIALYRHWFSKVTYLKNELRDLSRSHSPRFDRWRLPKQHTTQWLTYTARTWFRTPRTKSKVEVGF